MYLLLLVVAYICGKLISGKIFLKKCIYYKIAYLRKYDQRNTAARVGGVTAYVKQVIHWE